MISIFQYKTLLYLTIALLKTNFIYILKFNKIFINKFKNYILREQEIHGYP